jgi:hypothetical protein
VTRMPGGVRGGDREGPPHSIAPRHERVAVGKAVLLLEKYEVLEEWTPAFPTELIRGLKAHGTTMDNSRMRA